MTAKLWYIIWEDGRVVGSAVLPPRPLSAQPISGGMFTPYYDACEHRHRDGSYHILAANVEEARQRVNDPTLKNLPIQATSGRLLSIRKIT